MREHKHGRDLMNPASPTFSFPLLSTWVLRLRDLFRVREPLMTEPGLWLYFSFSFLSIPLWYLRPGASLPCSGQFAFPSYHSVIQWYMFSICNGLNALQALRNTGAIEEGTVPALWEFTLMGKKKHHWIGNGKVEYDVCYASQYLVCVGGIPHLLWAVGWWRRTSGNTDN